MGWCFSFTCAAESPGQPDLSNHYIVPAPPPSEIGPLRQTHHARTAILASSPPFSSESPTNSARQSSPPPFSVRDAKYNLVSRLTLALWVLLVSCSIHDATLPCRLFTPAVQTATENGQARERGRGGGGGVAASRIIHLFPFRGR